MANKTSGKGVLATSGGKSLWFKVAALSGIITPIVAFSCIALAIAYYPPFSWTDNALSDLGVVEGITSIVFNGGLIVSGILATIFAVGLYAYLGESTVGKAGSLLFVLDTLALMLIGVFPENVKPTHYYVSVMFFMLFPIAMLVLTATFLKKVKTKMGLFTFLVAAFAAAVWIIQWTVGFGSNVAIPETLSALAASAWAIVLGVKMLKEKP
ncbi:MAG: DUF998 domain-containing protein [Candidatus Bathyarchaeia archaeon]